jgi:hypothetical protein
MPRRARPDGARATRSQIPHMSDSEALETEIGSQSTSGNSGRVWYLWFPVRPGPPRKVKRRIAGVEVVQRVTRLELPPTKNNHAKDPHSHSNWVKFWRAEGWAAARTAGIPALARIRLSAVVYRERLGIADAENDHARLAPLQDGIVDAGVIPKDTYRYCERGTVTEERAGKEEGPGILLIVEEVL